MRYHHYAAALLLLPASLVSLSCNKRVDYIVKGEFRYYNRLTTPINIEIRDGLSKAYEMRNVPAGDSFVVYTNEIGPEDAGPQGYRPGLYAASTTIHFNDTLCYVEYSSDSRLLHRIDKYAFYKRGNSDYVFFFDIDTTLFFAAGKCP